MAQTEVDKKDKERKHDDATEPDEDAPVENTDPPPEGPPGN